jgi:hypothetical protein
MAFTRPKAAQIDFDVTNISDPLIRLNSGQSGSADKDVGIVVERGSDTNVALLYDESADEFVLVNTTEDGTTSGNVTISSYADLRVAGLTASSGTMTGALAMGTNKITGMGDPTANQDAATKAYVDTQVSSVPTGDITAVNITAGTGLSGTVSTSSGDHTQTLAIDSTVATLTGTQTLENKTLRAPTFESGSNAPEFLETRYVNATQQDFVQNYTGASSGSYFTQGEYQKVATIIPSADAQNYTFRLRMTATSASNYQIVEFTGALRSNTLPDLSFTSNYYEEHNGTRFIEPKLWTKETTTAGFILAFEYVHNANLYGGVNVEATIIPRSDDQRANVTFNTTQNSEQSSVETDYTENDPTLIYSNVSGTLEFGTQFRIEGSTSDGNELTITATDPTADRTITFPDATGTVSLITATETLTNKTIDSASNTLTLDLSEGTLTGTTSEFNSALSDGSFATLAGTETLTNKTLTSPTINAFSGTGNGSITGTLTVSGAVNFDDTTGSTSTTTGALIVDGGVGIAENLYVGGTIDMDRLSLTSSQTTVPPLRLTANSLNDGVGALRIDGSQADIYLNPSTATHTTVTFAVNEDQRLAFGMDNNSDFYITRRTGGSWYDDTFVIDRDTGLLSLGYGFSVGGDATITGNLTVNGTTTTISTTNSVVSDSLIELNTGASSNANDLGIVMERGSTGDNAIIAWDESADKFIVGTTTATGASTGDLTITTGTLVANIEGNVTGTAGSVSADDISAGDAAVNITTTSGSITLDAQGNNTDIIFKGTDGGADITALTLDMSVAGTARFNNGVEGSYFWGSKTTDNAVTVYAGANFEIRLTHVHNTGFVLTNLGTGTPAVELQFVDANEAIGSDGTNLLLTSGGSEITVPASAGNLVVDSATQTLTNKTLTTPVISSISNTGTITLPTSTDTLVGRATTDTLTNKTLTSPQIGTDIRLNAQAEIEFYDSDSSHYVSFRAPATITSSLTWTLPASDGTDGQVLSTNGAGTLAWEDAGSGGGSGSSYPNSTFTTCPGSEGDFDLSFNVAQTTQETPFEASGTDAFGVNLGSVFSLMDPVGSTEGPFDMGVLT